MSSRSIQVVAWVSFLKAEWYSGVQTRHSLLTHSSELQTFLRVWAFLTLPCRSPMALPFTDGPAIRDLDVLHPPLGVLFLASWLLLPATLPFLANPSPRLSGLLSELLSVGKSSVQSVFKSFNDEIQTQKSICNMTGFKEK